MKTTKENRAGPPGGESPSGRSAGGGGEIEERSFDD